MRLSLARTLLLLIPVVAPAHQVEPPKPVAQVSFHFERPGLDVPKFTLTVGEDGNARYEAEQVLTRSKPSDEGTPPATQPVDHTFTISSPATRHIFTAARELDRFNFPCASLAKNIANTGTKTLHFTGDGGEGTCVYNYSQDKRVVSLTDTFQAIAATLDFGRKLDFDHRFDRLDLDAVTAVLVSEIEAGRAKEIGAIAPSLQSIVADSEVLERVRSRAAKLLQQAQPVD